MKEKLSEIINKLVDFLKKHKKQAIIIGSASAVVLALIIGCAVYANDYYHADEEAISALVGHSSSIDIYELQNGVTVCEPTVARAGFIFYPGGKVECSAYLPLMESLAARGILTVLIEMPLNLAVLDVNAADGISESFPEIDSWYIGGHSLGGSMAASYLAKNQDEIDGLVLLGSYSTADIKDSRVLSVYGENDGVMNREKYDKYKSNLPEDLDEFVIKGGNHAYFGIYGEQDGDGKATITQIEQIVITADLISQFIK